MKEIFISDLDGTLLRNNATLSEFALKKLKQILESGILFTVASARSVASMRPILRDLPFSLPVIEFNGAFISDLKTGLHRTVQSIDSGLTQKIFSIIRRNGLWPFISGFNGEKDCLYYQKIDNNGMAWYLRDRTQARDSRLKKSRHLEDTLADRIICFTVIDREDILRPLALHAAETFAGQVEIHFYENFYSPGWYWLTIHDRRATKDQAIKTLLYLLKLKPENLTVFGDDINDLKMFKFAARAVSVENAHPQIKKLATEVIGTNEEDSVVKYILKRISLSAS